MPVPQEKFDSRRQFHAIFNEWLDKATESDFSALIAARIAYAPESTCSMYTLLTNCLNDPTASNLLPKSLTTAMAAFRPVDLPLYVVGA